MLISEISDASIWNPSGTASRVRVQSKPVRLMEDPPRSGRTCASPPSNKPSASFRTTLCRVPFLLYTYNLRLTYRLWAFRLLTVMDSLCSSQRFQMQASETLPGLRPGFESKASPSGWWRTLHGVVALVRAHQVISRPLALGPPFVGCLSYYIHICFVKPTYHEL